MNGFEAAIRNALERSDRTNPEVRARIYQSARQALEAGLRKQGVDDPTRVAQQRRRLELLITSIEIEEQKATRPVPQPREEPGFAEVAPPMRDHDGHGRREPGFDSPAQTGPTEAGEPVEDSGLRAERDDSFVAAPVHAHGEHSHDGSGLDEAVEHEASRVAEPRKRGFYARLFIFATLFFCAVATAVWIYDSGALMSEAERDTSVPNPPPKVVEEDFAGRKDGTEGFDPQGGFSGDWTEIFTPGDAPKLKVGAAAKIEAVTASSGPALRIVSSRSGSDGDVRIALPVDVLRAMAGKSSTIALTMQSATSNAAEVSVQCQFGSLGNCDRHRFTANQEKFDALFTVELPRGLTPSAPGALILNTGLGGSDSKVDLFSVRILPGS